MNISSIISNTSISLIKGSTTAMTSSTKLSTFATTPPPKSPLLSLMGFSTTIERHVYMTTVVDWDRVMERIKSHPEEATCSIENRYREKTVLDMALRIEKTPVTAGVVTLILQTFSKKYDNNNNNKKKKNKSWRGRKRNSMDGDTIVRDETIRLASENGSTSGEVMNILLSHYKACTKLIAPDYRSNGIGNLKIRGGVDDDDGDDDARSSISGDTTSRILQSQTDYYNNYNNYDYIHNHHHNHHDDIKTTTTTIDNEEYEYDEELHLDILYKIIEKKNHQLTSIFIRLNPEILLDDPELLPFAIEENHPEVIRELLWSGLVHDVGGSRLSAGLFVHDVDHMTAWDRAWENVRIYDDFMSWDSFSYCLRCADLFSSCDKIRNGTSGGGGGSKKKNRSLLSWDYPVALAAAGGFLSPKIFERIMDRYRMELDKYDPDGAKLLIKVIRCSHVRRTKRENWRRVVHRLLKRYANAVKVEDGDGHLALHAAAKYLAWDEGLEDVLKANYSALSVQDSDGLYPFMLAGLRHDDEDGGDGSDYTSISAAFELLRENPSVIQI